MDTKLVIPKQLLLIDSIQIAHYVRHSERSEESTKHALFENILNDKAPL